jgi:site-specific recombinase XerD
VIPGLKAVRDLIRCPQSDGFPGQPGLPRPRVTYTATMPSVSPPTSIDEGWLCSAAMTDLTELSASDALDRLAAWRVALRAENKSPGTVTLYADGVTRYLRWCAERDHLPMRRASLNQWVAGMLDAGAAPGTARIRQQAVRRFASWLTAGGELPADPFPGVKAPCVEPPLVQPLTDAELRALIATCAVPDDTAGSATTGEDVLHHRRDEAIIRLMFETAIRSGELVDLQVDDLDIVARLITIRRGKGGRGRVIPIGHATIEALLVYLHEREQHPLAATQDLWLGSRGKQFGREGLSRCLRRRAVRAGVQRFRPHRLRHTAAHRWLAAGGSESGLMAIAGWTRTDMLVRYTRARASERAADEARRLNLGEL